jgi:hypothetical protein
VFPQISDVLAFAPVRAKSPQFDPVAASVAANPTPSPIPEGRNAGRAADSRFEPGRMRTVRLQQLLALPQP